MRNAVPWNGEWLCKGSDAYELYWAYFSAEPKSKKEAKAKFEAHLRLLDQQYIALHGQPPEKGIQCHSLLKNWHTGH